MNIKSPGCRISVVLTDGVTPTLQQSIALLFSGVFIARSSNLASVLLCRENCLVILSCESEQQPILGDNNRVNEEQTTSFVDSKADKGCHYCFEKGHHRLVQTVLSSVEDLSQPNVHYSVHNSTFHCFIDSFNCQLPTHNPFDFSNGVCVHIK